MKLRTGFVSNSSSSSFIVLGYRIKADNTFMNKMIDEVYPDGIETAIKNKEVYDKDDALYDVRSYIKEKYNIIFLEHWETSFETDKDESIICVILSDINSEDGDYVGKMELSFESCENEIKIIKDNFNVSGTPTLFIGTRCC